MKRANISKLYDPNLHCNPGVPATTNLSWPQRYRYSRTIFFPFESPRNRYANSYPLDRGLSAESYKLARTNLSPYFHSLSPPLSSVSLPFCRIPPFPGIQLSAIWNVEAGQRVNPFPIRVVAVILKERWKRFSSIVKIWYRFRVWSQFNSWLSFSG